MILKSRVVEKRIKDKNGKIFTYIAIVIDYKDSSGKWKQHYHNTKVTISDYHRNKKKMVEQTRAQIAAEFKKKLEKQRGVCIDYENITVLQLLRKYADTIKADGKISEKVYLQYVGDYINKMKAFLLTKGKEDITLSDFTENNAEEFVDYLRTRKNRYGDSISDNTIKHHLSFFKPAFRFAFEKMYINVNLFSRIKAPKVALQKPDFFSIAETETIWEALEHECLAIPIKLSVWTGLRRSELLGLKWSVVDLKNSIIKIEEKVLNINGKGLRLYKDLKTESSYRSIPLSPEAVELFLQQKQLAEANKKNSLYNNKYSDYVFVDRFGEFIHPDRLTRTVKRICEKNNIEGHFHKLRHTYATQLRKGGAKLEVIQELLGHSTFSTTVNYYLGVDIDDKKEAIDKLSQRLKFKKN